MESGDEKGSWVCTVFCCSGNADHVDVIERVSWFFVDFYMSYTWI